MFECFIDNAMTGPIGPKIVQKCPRWLGGYLIVTHELIARTLEMLQLTPCNASRTPQ
jgi:hypothetical protein